MPDAVNTSEVIDVVAVTFTPHDGRTPASYWLVLDCGHWHKHQGRYPPPAAGEGFSCPSCAVPVTVVGRS